MRILQILSHYVAEKATDGVSVAANGLIKSLRRIGGDVTVFSISSQVEGGAERVVHSPESARELYFHSWANSRFAISGSFLRECLRRVAEFDVVHIHGLWRFPSTSGALACRHTGVPYVLSPHGMLNDWAIRSHAYWKLPLWYGFWAKALMETSS